MPDRGAWGMTLADSAERLRNTRPEYQHFRHRPLYTVETFSKEMSTNYDYLVKKVKLQARFFG